MDSRGEAYQRHLNNTCDGGRPFTSASRRNNHSDKITDVLDSIVDRVSREFTQHNRQLQDYIYYGAVRLLSRRNKSAFTALERKDLRELPFSTPYAISDIWAGAFSARIFIDGSKSRYG